MNYDCGDHDKTVIITLKKKLDWEVFLWTSTTYFSDTHWQMKLVTIHLTVKKVSRKDPFG